MVVILVLDWATWLSHEEDVKPMTAETRVGHERDRLNRLQRLLEKTLEVCRGSIQNAAEDNME